MRKLTPQEIEVESFRIIDQEAGPHPFDEKSWQMVRRIIHATADFEFIRTMRFHPRAITAGLEALRRGATVYADTNMLASAMSRAALEKLGCKVLCLVSDEAVREESRKTGETRSAVAMRKGAPMLDGGIVVIGNAPTALHEAVTLCEQGALSPALVIGMPVGFVEAWESKQRLSASKTAFITNLARKGGTPAAAAVVNAMLKMTERG